jgi:hypothetical protein
MGEIGESEDYGHTFVTWGCECGGRVIAEKDDFADQAIAASDDDDEDEEE